MPEQVNRGQREPRGPSREAASVVWLGVESDARWTLYVNGSTVIASGLGDYAHSLNSGWLPVRLTIDPVASTISGAVGGNSFGPISATLSTPASRVGFEAAGNFFNGINNLRIVRGTPLSLNVNASGAPSIGGTLTLTANSNAAAPAGYGLRHDGSTITDGPTPAGSVISGAGTSSLTVSNFTTADAGAYDAIAFNACGNATSAAISISPCYANCDQSSAPPILNSNDFVCFINQFAAGNAYANCDGSTAQPTLNALDFQCFLNRFAAGCT